MAVEVQPTDSLDILRSKVHFFKLFWQRKHQLIEKSSNKVLKDLNQTFRDCGIKNNDTLVLRDTVLRGNGDSKAEELKHNE